MRHDPHESCSVAFGAWTNAILRQGEALSLCQSFRDVREEGELLPASPSKAL